MIDVQQEHEISRRHSSAGYTNVAMQLIVPGTEYECDRILVP